MSRALRSALVGVGAILVLTLISSACSSSGSASAGSTGTSGSSSAINVQVTQMFLEVENRAGGPLRDINISIRPSGVMPPFTTRIDRLETGEKRTLAFGEFTGRDGTRFNPNVARARDVTVTGVDVQGQSHEVKVPFSR